MNPSFSSMPMGVQGGLSPSPAAAAGGAPPPLPAGQQPQQQLMVPPGQTPQPQSGGSVQAVPPSAAQGSIPRQQQATLSGPGAPSGQASATSPGVRMAAGPPSGPPSTPSAAFQAMRPFAPPQMMPNFMSAPPVPMPQQQMMPPGVLGTSPAGMPPRYSAPPFNSMAARPSTFVPRPPLGPPPPVTMSAMSLPRPPGNGLRPLPPVLKPPPGMSLTELAAKGVGQLSAPPEKPHTTVYVGKIAPTIEDDFLRALLELCGDIKSWKRAQDPTTGSPKGFGFCEFDSAEGVLRALRILNKYNLEGQELVLNVNQATREYLERYVTKKKEREKFLQQQVAEMEKDEELAPGVESIEAPKPPLLFMKDDGADKESGAEEVGKKFGLVSTTDTQADELAILKMNGMLEERSRLRPLPPPPPLPAGVDGLKSGDVASKSRDGDVSGDATKSDDPSGKNDDDTTSDHRASGDNERNEMTSADKGGRRSERDRERDREREIEREKERELERYERERERERTRRERDREMKVREAERIYEEREREWEAREREKERQRLHDREREKDRERDRRKEIQEQEEESDDDDWKKSRYRGSLLEEKRKRRLREREEDSADREREELEILSKKQKTVESASEKVSEGDDEDDDDEMDVVEDDEPIEIPMPKVLHTADSTSIASVSDADEEQPQKILNSNGTHSARRPADVVGAVVSSEADPKSSPAPRKLGFGIMGSGRRAAGLSVFHQEDEEEKTDDRRLRPLVPIDYSAEEMEAVATPNPPRASSPQVASNLAAAAEFARSLSGFAGSNISKEDRKEDGDRDRSRRKRDRHEERDSSRKEKTRERERERERDREREDREREREREKDRERKDAEKEREKEHVVEKIKDPEPKKILDAKQLIDTIPKTKEELFAYPVDWEIYDQHDLHERMRPWISKKITEFLGEEETTLVDFIVSNTCKHVTAASMLDLLESILDDEAELFVLKMWRMLIFEIRRIETGLAGSKAKS